MRPRIEHTNMKFKTTRTKRWLSLGGSIAAVVLIGGAAIAYEYMLLSECLSKNSFFFCLRVLDK